jgi:hypothetical protein
MAPASADEMDGRPVDSEVMHNVPVMAAVVLVIGVILIGKGLGGLLSA